MTTFHVDYDNLALKEDDILPLLKQSGIAFTEVGMNLSGPQASSRKLDSSQAPSVDADELNSLREQLIAKQTEIKDMQGEMIRLRELVQLLENTNEDAAEIKKATHGSGIQFPYSTRELEVMRDMAVKYWACYNAETDRKPLQKQIGIEISQIMNWTLSSSGDPSRQAVSLATAIHPKQYRGKK